MGKSTKKKGSLVANLNTNCFTIANGDNMVAGVPIREGIRLTWTGDDPYVILGANRRISIASGTVPTMPIVAKRIFRARVCGERRLRNPSPECTSIIVKIMSRNLRFGFEPIVEGLNLWAGGDATFSPILQYGAHKDVEIKEQLYEIQHGESILVVDERAAVAQLQCVGGTAVLSPVDPTKLAIMMVERAILQRKVQAFDWALHNLRIIQQSRTAVDWAVRGALDELNRRRAAL